MAGMKRPLIVLGISIGMIVLGSVVCLPGICGCVSWVGLPDTRFSYYFLFLWMAGLPAAGFSLVWLAVSAIRVAWNIKFG
jgi:hypothetical protein